MNGKMYFSIFIIFLIFSVTVINVGGRKEITIISTDDDLMPGWPQRTDKVSKYG